MCGIAGLVENLRTAEIVQTIKRMTDAIAHRGPDAEGLFVAEKAALGHRRLSIIDLNENANQPMTDNSGRYTIVFNGEIYNFREVQAKLQEYSFKTNSDTEVLLAAYAQKGVACLDDLNGMFAFAIWDARDQSLFVARDRVGKKPLYYFQNENVFLFASELRAVLNSGVAPRRLDRAALSEYLQFYSIGAPRTLIENVRVLLPGSYLIFQKGELTEKKYWSYLSRAEQTIEDDYQTVTRRVKNLLQSSVEQRLISDVTLGAFLSGGIDSSAIVALMATTSEQPVKTFSVNFDEEKYDESIYSSLIARKYRTEHFAVRLTSKDFLASLPNALAAMDFPTVDGVNTFVVSKATKNAGCAVALSGLGGDELFAGYPVFTQYQQIKRFEDYYRLPQTLRRFVGRCAAAAKKDHKAARREQLLSLANADFENLYPIFRRGFSQAEAVQLTRNISIAANPLARMFSAGELKKIGELPLLSQVSIGELSSFTLNLLLRDTDQMSMAHALEVRAPFLDYKLIEYVLSLPDAFKQPIYPKKLLVDALGELLPDEIVRRKKMGFSFPWDDWLRGDLREFCDAKIARLKKRDLFDAQVLDKLQNDFARRAPRAPWIKIWLLVILEDWLERNRIDV